MNGAGIILLAMQICGALSVHNSRTSHVIVDVAMALAEQFGPMTMAMTMLRGNDLTWRDEQEMFVVMKSMSFVHWKYSVVIDFRSYAIMLNRKRRSMMSQGMSLLFGWHGRSKSEFEKLSQNVYLADSKWLLLLKSGQSPKVFMNDLDLYVNTHIVVAEISNRSRIELIDGYKILPYDPLQQIRLGHWDARSRNLETNPVKPYPLRRSDLKGLNFRVTATMYKPISTVSMSKDSKIALGGLFGLVLNELSSTLNFTSTYVPPVENYTGAISPNGSWSGLIGMVQRNETDLILGPTSYKRRVLKTVSILRPLVRSYYQIFFKSSTDVIGISAIFKPFNVGVWIVMVIWTAVAAGVLGLAFRMAYVHGSEERFSKHEFYNLSSLFVVFQALCQQGHYMTPRSIACRICFLIAYVASIVIVTSYSAILISDLTVDTPHRPFDSLEGFLQEGSHKLLVSPWAPDYSYFVDANDNLRRAIFRKSVQTVKESEFPKTLLGSIEKICEDGNYALFVTYEIVRFLTQDVEASKKCRILHFTQPLDRVFMSIATHRRAPYITLMDYHIQRMTEAGIIHRMRMTLNFYQITYETYWKSVTLQQAFQIHTVLLVGLLLSLLAFAAEVAISRTTGFFPRRQSDRFVRMQTNVMPIRKYNRYYEYLF